MVYGNTRKMHRTLTLALWQLENNKSKVVSSLFLRETIAKLKWTPITTTSWIFSHHTYIFNATQIKIKLNVHLLWRSRSPAWWTPTLDIYQSAISSIVQQYHNHPRIATLHCHWKGRIASLVDSLAFVDPGLEVIKLEFSLKLKIKRIDWLLYFEFEIVLKFYNFEARVFL